VNPAFSCGLLVLSLVSVGLYVATAVAALVIALQSARERYRRTMWLLFAILTAISVLNGTEFATYLFGAPAARRTSAKALDWAMQAQLVVEWALTAALGVVLLGLGRLSRERLGSDVSA
jgi:hypothetical protein